MISISALALAAALLAAAPITDPIPLTLASSAAVLGAIASDVRQTRMGWFAPVPLLAAGIVLYLIPLPLTARFGGIITHVRFNQTSIDMIETATVLHGLGLLALTAGYRISTGVRTLKIKRALPEWPLVPGVVVSVALVALGAIAAVAMLGMIGGMGALRTGTYGDRYLLTRGLGPILATSRVVGVGALILYAMGVKRSRRLLQLAGVGLVIGYFGGWLIVFQQRRPLFQALVALVIVRQALGQRARLGRLALLGLLLFVGSVAVGIWRGGVSTSLVGFVVERPYLLNPANTELGAPILTTAEISATTPNTNPFALGESYAEIGGGLVPRVIWPDRPYGAAEWYVRAFYPDVWSAGGGFAFSPFAEAYLNFGFLGVPFVLGIVGVVGGLIGRYLNQATSVPSLMAIAYGLVASWLIIFSRLDSLSFAKGALATLAPLLVAHLAIWSTFLIIKQARARSPATA